jgi:hypothetical protein
MSVTSDRFSIKFEGFQPDVLAKHLKERITKIKQKCSENVYELEIRMSVTAAQFYNSFQNLSKYPTLQEDYTHTIVCTDNSDVRRTRSEYTATQPPVFIQTVAKLRVFPPIDFRGLSNNGNLRIDVQEEVVTQDIVARADYFRMRERCSVVMTECSSWRVDYTRVVASEGALDATFEIEIELLQSGIESIQSLARLDEIAEEAVLVLARVGVG